MKRNINGEVKTKTREPSIDTSNFRSLSASFAILRIPICSLALYRLNGHTLYPQSSPASYASLSRLLHCFQLLFMRDCWIRESSFIHDRHCATSVSNLAFFVLYHCLYDKRSGILGDYTPSSFFILCSEGTFSLRGLPIYFFAKSSQIFNILLERIFLIVSLRICFRSSLNIQRRG